jgi:hypothetical protein
MYCKGAAKRTVMARKRFAALVGVHDCGMTVQSGLAKFPEGNGLP